MHDLPVSLARAAGTHDGVIVVALVAVATLVLGLHAAAPPGSLGAGMLQHVAVMNVAAPATALMLGRTPRMAWLWPVTVAQLVLLWAAHLPTSASTVPAGGAHSLVMHAALFAAALLFWHAIVSGRCARWASIFALLVTAKLACLLGALLVFATRPLYATSRDAALALADQQFAGLVMIAACPLSYVVVAVGLTAQAIGGIDARGSPRVRRL